MIERFGFLTGECEHFLHSRRIGNVADHFGFRAGADLFFHFHADSLKIETHFLQNVYCYPLPQFDEPQQKMFGSDVIVIKPVCFLTGKRQNLLRARCEIIHI